MSDPCGEMIALLLQCKHNAEAASQKQYERENELRCVYDQMLRNDEVLKKHTTELEEWQKTLKQIKEEMFPPGTLIEWTNGTAYATRAGIPIRYMVVEGVDKYNTSLHTHAVLSPPSKRSSAMSVAITSSMRIIVPQMITDKQLRKNAEALILKVRLKDWHQ